MGTSADSYPPSYPDRLLINGRQVDAHFEDDEDLYVRFRGLDMTTGRPDGTDLHCPDQSVNRGKYSDAQDVLLARYPDCLGMGYGSLKVELIPKDVFGGDRTTAHVFRVIHVPLEVPLENYAHCEIRCFVDGERKTDTSRAVRKGFKQLLAERILVLKEPDNEPSGEDSVNFE